MTVCFFNVLIDREGLDLNTMVQKVNLSNVHRWRSYARAYEK